MTRLLIQKPVEYAELEEMARIAVSVLQDDGWSIQRVGLDFSVTITTQAIEKPGHLEVELGQAHLELAAAQARIATLRKTIHDDGADGWLAIMLGCSLCCGLNYLHLGNWDWVAALACFAVWGFVRGFSKKKGTK
jgi:hypothetical protein